MSPERWDSPMMSSSDIEEGQELLRDRYEDASKERDSIYDPIPKRTTSRTSWTRRRCRLWSMPHISIPTLLNLALLVTIIIFSAAYYSSIQSMLAEILKHQAHSAAIPIPKLTNSTWKVENPTSLVVFGDSYSAESELTVFWNHFVDHKDEEWKHRVNPNTTAGGYVWPRWFAWYTGAKLYNYAVGGAVCSTQITPQGSALAIQEHELVSFATDVAQTRDHTTPGMVDLPTEGTVYTIWLGANDFGSGGFLTNDQIQDKTLADWIECIFSAVDKIYALGGRNVIIMNVAPLDRSPTYNAVQRGGAKHPWYWSEKPAGDASQGPMTQMNQIVSSVNYGLRYQAAYEMMLSKRYAGAKLAYFDVHKLFLDIIDDPKRYLNGTAKANVTDSCNSGKTGEYKICTSRDSYLWYDELHPSEQTSRLVARELKKTIEGNGEYAEYWESPAI